MREAPSLVIIPELQAKGANIVAFDPVAMEEAAKQLNNVAWAENAYDVADEADILVILTEWNSIQSI